MADRSSIRIELMQTGFFYSIFITLLEKFLAKEYFGKWEWPVIFQDYREILKKMFMSLFQLLKRVLTFQSIVWIVITMMNMYITLLYGIFWFLDHLYCSDVYNFQSLFILLYHHRFENGVGRENKTQHIYVIEFNYLSMIL